MLNQISGLVGKHQIGFTQTQTGSMLIGLLALTYAGKRTLMKLKTPKDAPSCKL